MQRYFYGKAKLLILVENAIKDLLTITNAMPPLFCNAPH